MWAIIQDDGIAEGLRQIEDNQFDSIVTDPPYALSFMGKDWDSFGDGKGFQKWCEEWAREALRVLKPGGYLLAFGGTRTYHREACAIEDAGFEIRDSLHWIYGSGFPKSRDISKAIDSEAGAERTEVVGKSNRCLGPSQAGDNGIGTFKETNWQDSNLITAPATDDAKQWQGWGTALKPAHEPIVVARKPLSEKTVASNVLTHGTGAINVDGCRVSAWDAPDNPVVSQGAKSRYTGIMNGGKTSDAESRTTSATSEGRWPPNIILTHPADCVATGESLTVKTESNWGGKQESSIGYHGTDVTDYRTRSRGVENHKESVPIWNCSPDCPIAEMDRQSGTLTSGATPTNRNNVRENSIYRPGYKSGKFARVRESNAGGASRFFPCFESDPLANSACFKYNAKAPKKERPWVWGPSCKCKTLTADEILTWVETSVCSECGARAKKISHPTVKPVALMRWLVRLVTPPNGVVADFFAGTGATAEACELEGFDSVMMENDPEAIALMVRRMENMNRKWRQHEATIHE